MYTTIITGVYLIHNTINGKNYVGQSKHILNRWNQHRCDSKTKDYPLYQAGARDGDVITKINGKSVKTYDDINAFFFFF